MKFDHAVKLNGVLYPANTEIPEPKRAVDDATESVEPVKETVTKAAANKKKATKGDK